MNEKPKISIPLTDLAVKIQSANGAAFVRSYEDPDQYVDPAHLLRGAQIRQLSDKDKPDYIVIKFAYVLYDPTRNAVGVIDRVGGRHTNMVSEHSILLSSGLEQFYGASDVGANIVLNSYQPFTRKLGALVNEFELPMVKYKELDYPTRHFAFAARKSGNRYYAFFIHLAVLTSNTRFPRGAFPLNYPDNDVSQPPDEFQGFVSLEEAGECMSESPLAVDRFALSVLTGNRFVMDGIEGRKFTPKLSPRLILRRFWESVTLQPSIAGIGVDIKQLLRGRTGV